MADITAVIQHAALGAGNIHVPYDGIFADESARLAAQLDTSMEGKFYRQLSDNTLWMLVSASGAAWVALGKATAKHLGKGGDDNQPMTFFWQGQDGQPQWVWGGSDGENMYVYNPANFSVKHAATAEGLTAPIVELLTVSGTYIAKKTGPHFVILVGGGGGGGGAYITTTRFNAGGGGGGIMTVQNLTKGIGYSYTIGAGGAAGVVTDTHNNRPTRVTSGADGGTTTFNGVSIPGGGGGTAEQGAAGNILATYGGTTTAPIPGTQVVQYLGGTSYILNSYGRGGDGLTYLKRDDPNYKPPQPGQSGAILIIS